jgi:hypothetical protein
MEAKEALSSTDCYPRRNSAKRAGAGSGAPARVTGLVEMLGNFPRKGPWSEGPEVHSGLVLKTAKGRITVHLGPTWYFMEHDCPIRVGDKFEAVGVKVAQDRSALLLAQEVRVNGKSLKLYDKNGTPFWAKNGRSKRS